jgi:hypothetical protein
MRRLICAVAAGLGLALTNVSGVFAQSIQFSDDFTSPTLNPWWNANQQQSGLGYITYPASYLGVPCVQLMTLDSGQDYSVTLSALYLRYPGLRGGTSTESTTQPSL